MIRALKVARRLPFVDLLQEDTETGEEVLLRLFYKRIRSIDAARHGTTRSLLISELGKSLAERRDPPEVRKATQLAGRLRGIASDLTVYDQALVEAARSWREQERAARVRLEQWPEEVIAAAKVEARPADAPPVSDELAATLAEVALLEASQPQATLLRLLEREEQLQAELAAAEAVIFRNEQGRLEGLLKRLGRSGVEQSMEQREAIICAGVVRMQTLVRNHDHDAGDDSAPAWIPDPDEPEPVSARFDRTLEQPDLEGEVPMYPIGILSLDEINMVSEIIFQHSIGGRQGRAALERFRERPHHPAVPGAAGPGEEEVGA